MRSHELDVVLTRGSAVESYHRVHAAVVSDSDKLLGESGDPRAVTFWRSCAKPFQIMPFIASGGFDSLGWGDEELAIACGSHGGEPEHVALIGKMLDEVRLEIRFDFLECIGQSLKVEFMQQVTMLGAA